MDLHKKITGHFTRLFSVTTLDDDSEHSVYKDVS